MPHGGAGKSAILRFFRDIIYNWHSTCLIHLPAGKSGKKQHLAAQPGVGCSKLDTLKYGEV
jgi:hypothetical protein